MFKKILGFTFSMVCIIEGTLWCGKPLLGKKVVNRSEIIIMEPEPAPGKKETHDSELHDLQQLLDETKAQIIVNENKIMERSDKLNEILQDVQELQDNAKEFVQESHELESSVKNNKAFVSTVIVVVVVAGGCIIWKLRKNLWDKVRHLMSICKVLQ